MAVIFDGRKFADQKQRFLAGEFGKLAAKGLRPKLVFILIGESREARYYVSLKKKVAENLGVELEIKKFSKEADSAVVGRCISDLGQDGSVAGVTFEYPLPPEHKRTLPRLLPPQKDVDCLTPENLGRLLLGEGLVLPSSVRAILEVLNFAFPGGSSYLKGKLATVVGFGTLVGRPLSIVLKNLGATVTVCDEYTLNLSDHTKTAEILVSATGKPGLIKKEMVKKGAVVIDLGYPKGDFEPQAAPAASFFTPVPGGVGPVSIACLFENVLDLINDDPSQKNRSQNCRLAYP